ncbi:MAG: hypothetical protein WAY93_02515 [Atopobiaceae bacterium]|jgi:hypothetical protein|nr:hypothetical protein [Atopobiaceae bacterium]
MANSEKTSGLFRKSAQDKVSSPEQLDRYIKVASPSVWVALVAVLLFLAALAFWANTGKIPTNVSVNGAVKDGSVYCFVPSSEASKLRNGNPATVLGIGGAYVTSVSTTPLSSSEASQFISNDYSLSQLALSQWNYLVVVTPPLQTQRSLEEGTAVPVVVTTEESAPISFLFNGSSQ